MEKLNFLSAVRLIRDHRGDFKLQSSFYPSDLSENFFLTLQFPDGKSYIYEISDKLEYDRLLSYILKTYNYYSQSGIYRFVHYEETDR